MENFEYVNTTRLIFGKDTEKNVGALVKKVSDHVLLHYGGGSIIKSGLYDRIIQSLKKSGISYTELGGVTPNPRLGLVQKGISLCKQQKIGMVLAVGGGSVIDSAKAIALGACNERDVWDYFKNPQTECHGALPVGVILTIPGTGSESSNGTVITNEGTNKKYGYTNAILRPKFSIVNPELFYTVPRHHIANGICDMMSHIFERYFTNTTDVELTSQLCEATLKTIMKCGPRIIKNPKDYSSWAEVALASNIAHCGILGMGRQEDWACHKIEHELSAFYDVAHGAGLAIVIPAWMRYVSPRRMEAFKRFAFNVMDVPEYDDNEKIISEAIGKLQAFFQKIGLPSSLKDLGIAVDSNFEMMAKSAARWDMNNQNGIGEFVKLKWEDIFNIYLIAQQAE